MIPRCSISTVTLAFNKPVGSANHKGLAFSLMASQLKLWGAPFRSVSCSCSQQCSVSIGLFLGRAEALYNTHENDAVVCKLYLLSINSDLSLTDLFIQNAFWILLLAAWGCVGITQTRFGFHNAWEFWAYQAFYGVCGNRCERM